MVDEKKLAYIHVCLLFVPIFLGYGTIDLVLHVLFIVNFSYWCAKFLHLPFQEVLFEYHAIMAMSTLIGHHYYSSDSADIPNHTDSSLFSTDMDVVIN